MDGNSSSDDSDDSFRPTTEMAPKLREINLKNGFFDEVWPNSLRIESSASSGNSQAQTSVADVIKLIRNQFRAKNGGQNGTDNAQDSTQDISPDEFARITSTIDKQDLHDIIGSVKPPPPVLPQSLPHPPQPPQPPPPVALTTNVAPPHFNTGLPPPPVFYTPPSYHPMNGVPVNTAHPDLAAYIAPNMPYSIPTQFVPNGSAIGWPSPHSVHTNIPHVAPIPFSTNPNQIHQPNTQPKRIDPRLMPRPQFHQRQQPPSQSTPIRTFRPNCHPTRFGATNRSMESPTVKNHISVDDYLKRSQANQGDLNMAKRIPDASRTCDITRNGHSGHNGNMVPGIDPKSSINNNNVNDGDIDDDTSNEPAFSPAASLANASSPASVTPPPQHENENEHIPDDQLHESSDRQNSDQFLPTVKAEPCTSDVATDYSSDSTVEFNMGNLKQLEGLNDDDDDSSELISNENVTATSTKQMHEDTNDRVPANSLHTQHVASTPKPSPQAANQTVSSQQQLATSVLPIQQQKKQQQKQQQKKLEKQQKLKKQQQKQQQQYVDTANPSASTASNRCSTVHDKPRQLGNKKRDNLNHKQRKVTSAKDGKMKIKAQKVQNVPINKLDEIEDKLKDLDGSDSPTYTPDKENVLDIQNPTEIEKYERCFIYLMDIRNTARFDKYLKKVDEPNEPADDPKTPADDLLLQIQDRSPIEVPDSDDEDENIDNNNSRRSSSSSSINDPQFVVVISDSD